VDDDSERMSGGSVVVVKTCQPMWRGGGGLEGGREVTQKIGKRGKRRKQNIYFFLSHGVIPHVLVGGVDRCK